MKIANFRAEAITRTCKKNYNDYHSYRKDLEKDFHRRCCYCNLSEDTLGVIPFQIDHFIPKHIFKDKQNQMETQYSNLVLACPKCNRAKSDQYKGDISSPEIVNELFYNPDEVDYNDIFYRNEVGGISSDDPKGKDIIIRLKLYRTIHNYAWIVEKLNNIIDALNAQIDNIPQGENRQALERIQSKLLDKHYRMDKQLHAAYLSQ